MNIAIISEFNPFHDGHKYLIEKVKKEDDKVICFMSGNFVQRGEFAIYDKFQRAKSALENGADLIIELPIETATSSAEGFAKGAIELIHKTNIIDKIVCGAENDNIDLLKSISNTLNSNKFQEKVKEEMKNGISYPVARKNVLNSDVLDFPNNILACEYLRFSNIPIELVKRLGKGLNSDDVVYSANAIRSTLSPENIVSMYNCEKAILYKLRSMTKDDFLKIEDVNEGLENRLMSAANQSTTLDELYSNIKSKRYTETRIKRIVLRCFLGITKESIRCPYIRILGFNERGKELLPLLKKNANMPIISKYKECSNDNEIEYFDFVSKTTDIYNLGYKKTLPCKTEQSSQIVLI